MKHSTLFVFTALTLSLATTARAEDRSAMSCRPTLALIDNVHKLQHQNDQLINFYCAKRNEELCRQAWAKKTELQETEAQLVLDLKNQGCR